METPFPVTVHPYPSTRPDGRPRAAYEYGPPARNALIFIGGLGDGPFDVPYIRTIASKLTSENLPYSVFEICLSSAYSAFGYGSLAQDIEDIAALVRYLRAAGQGREKIVLMGHSTGCQDCMEYAAKGEEGVDGFVLQGSVSDREAIVLAAEGVEGGMEVLRESVSVAEGMVSDGRGEEVVPAEKLPEEWRGSPITAYRWYSLAAKGGDEDYFSSDLSDEKLAVFWGRVQKPILIVLSDADEFVPASVDVSGQMGRWKSFCNPGIASDLSGLIPGANHRVDDSAAQDWLADRVARFLAGTGKVKDTVGECVE